MKLRNLLVNSILVVIAVLLSLSVLEIGYRLIVEKQKSLQPKTNWASVPEQTWTEYHPELGWFHQKNKKAILKITDHEVQVDINSDGLRSQKEYGLEKSPKKNRVLALGDSFFFGWGVNNEETFASQMERRYPNCEVLNLGVPGYGVDQMLVAYRTIGQKFNPDVVLIGIFPEDFWRATRSFADSGYAKPYFSLTESKQLNLHNIPVPKPFELKYNQFPEIVERNMVEKVLMYSYIYRTLKRGVIAFGKRAGWVAPDSTEEWILGRAILSQLVQEIRKNNAQAIMVIIPPYRWFFEKRYDAIHSTLLFFAKKEKVEFIDLTENFREAINRSRLEKYYIKNDWHWTKEGHRLMADVLSNDLKKRGFI